MKNRDLIKQAKAMLKKHNVRFGKFWCITRSAYSFTAVWFWRADDGQMGNPSVQFDEERGVALWCNQ